MRCLFLDSSYLIALEASDDQHHSDAQTHWKNLIEDLPHLVTTTWIFDEVLTFFNSRRKHTKAVEIGNNLLHSPSVTLIQVEQPLFHKGWMCFQQYDDKMFSLTDCVSFALMRDQKISGALTFDHHFTQAGFQCLP